MKRAYHNLAGLCRDLRAATAAASEGDSEAAELCDAFYDALGLLDAFVEGDLDGGENPDDAASGDDAESENSSVPSGPPEGRRVGSVGTVGQSPTVRSVRAGVAAARRGSSRRSSGDVAVPCGTPVSTARRSPGGRV